MRVEQCLFVGQNFHCLLLRAQYRKPKSIAVPSFAWRGDFLLPTAFQRFFSSLRTHSLLRASLCPVHKWLTAPWSGARQVAGSWCQKCPVLHPAGIGGVSFMVSVAEGGFVKCFWRSLWFAWNSLPSVIECNSVESVNSHPSDVYQCAREWRNHKRGS